MLWNDRISGMLITSLLLISCDESSQQQNLSQLMQENAKLKQALEMVRASRDSLQGSNALLRIQVEGYENPDDARLVKERQLHDPTRLARLSLVEQQSLLPRPVRSLGWNFETIHVLPDRYVFAIFSNGHSLGQMLVRGKPRDDGMSWEQLWMRSPVDTLSSK